MQPYPGMAVLVIVIGEECGAERAGAGTARAGCTLPLHIIDSSLQRLPL